MKKIIFTFVLVVVCTALSAKSPKPDELCAALNGLYEVDGSEIVIQRVIELKDMSKSDIYLQVQEYINKTYRDANSVIQIEDKEAGKIVAKGCYQFRVNESFALSALLFTSWHVFKAEIKEGKVRITISSENTEYEQSASQYSSYRKVNCALVKCYPIQDPGAYFLKHLDGYIFYHSVLHMINQMTDVDEYLQKAQKKSSTNEDW